MKTVILNLNYVLEKIKKDSNLSNSFIAKDILRVVPSQVTNYLNYSSILPKEKGLLLNEYLKNHHNKTIYDYIFTLINEDGFYFHGSKNKIIGEINLNISVDTHDFGKGFYLGETFLQSSTWASDQFNDGNIYKCKLDLDGLDCLILEGIEWILFVGFCRGKIENIPENKEILKYCNEIIEHKYDVIIGKIADDKMGFSMESFFANRITDKTVYECLQKLKIGNQYCIKTEKAKTHLKLLEHYHLENSLKEIIDEYGHKSRETAAIEAKILMDNEDNDGLKFSKLRTRYEYKKR